MRIFDTHVHYDSAAFDEDRESLLDSLKEAGVERFTDICAEIEDVDAVLNLALSRQGAYCALGIHPSSLEGMNEGVLEKIAGAARSHPKKVAAVGEIGLDYHWEHDEAVQKKWFERQLDLALSLDLPVVIHSRDAAADTLEIMSKYASSLKGAVIHCFSYSKEMALEYVRLGFYIGVGGVVTFKNARKLKEAVEAVSIERILLETDCPYLAPEPFRGRRNSSLYLPYVIETIADIKGLGVEETAEALWENACSFYGVE